MREPLERVGTDLVDALELVDPLLTQAGRSSGGAHLGREVVLARLE